MEDTASAAGTPLVGNDPTSWKQLEQDVHTVYVKVTPELVGFAQRDGYLTRVRLEAQGPSAAEVEAALVSAACEINERLSLESGFGEQFTQREMGEPEGDTAFSGRLVMHPNVATDAAQHDRLRQIREAEFQPIRPPYLPDISAEG